MIYGNVTPRVKVHAVVHRSRPFGVAKVYYARTACGKTATLKVGTLDSTLPLTGDEPSRVDCGRCTTWLRKQRPELFPGD